MIDEDAPVTLKEAIEIVFRGKIGVGTLRAEAARGRLEIRRIGKRDFTTLRSVREMVTKCPGVPLVPDCTLIERGTSGLSETERGSFAQAALDMKISELTSRSPPTSHKNTNRRRAAVR